MRVRLWGAPGGSSDGTLLPSFGAGPGFVQISQLFMLVPRREEVAGVVGRGVAPLSLSGGPTRDAVGAARGCVCALCTAGSSCQGGRVPVSAPAAPTLAASAGTALSPAGSGGIRGGFTRGRWQSPGECGQGGRWAPSLHVLAVGMAGAARDALSHTASLHRVPPTWGRVP